MESVLARIFLPVQAAVSKQWGHWDLFGPHRSRIAASIFPHLPVLALEYSSGTLEAVVAAHAYACGVVFGLGGELLESGF